jgi:serine protease inhibitor
MIILSEHDAFQRIAQGLAMAKDGAQMMAAHQPEKAFGWQKMAQVFEVCTQSVNKLSEEAASKVMKS